MKPFNSLSDSHRYKKGLTFAPYVVLSIPYRILTQNIQKFINNAYLTFNSLSDSHGRYYWQEFHDAHIVTFNSLSDSHRIIRREERLNRRNFQFPIGFSRAVHYVYVQGKVQTFNSLSDSHAKSQPHSISKPIDSFNSLSDSHYTQCNNCIRWHNVFQFPIGFSQVVLLPQRMPLLTFNSLSDSHIKVPSNVCCNVQCTFNSLSDSHNKKDPCKIMHCHFTFNSLSDSHFILGIGLGIWLGLSFNSLSDSHGSQGLVYWQILLALSIPYRILTFEDTYFSHNGYVSFQFPIGFSHPKGDIKAEVIVQIFQFPIGFSPKYILWVKNTHN